MADGNLGSLYMSLDLRDETQGKIQKINENIKSLEKGISTLQKKINDSSKEMHTFAEGSAGWERHRYELSKMIKEVDGLVSTLSASRKEAASLSQRLSSIDAGKLVTPHKSFISTLDTKPIEKQIEKLEKYEQLLKRIQDLQGKKYEISLDAQQGLGGTHAWNTYQKRIQEVDEQISKVKANLQELGGGNTNLNSVRSQLDSLYGTLERFDSANKNATVSIRDNRSELEKHRAKQKEVEAAFAPLLAAQQRAAQQEAANRVNIEATNAARQKQVQVLREQSEAMMRAKLSELQSNRSQMAGLYSTGRNVGLNEGELANIRQRYQEISREILTIQTLLQNSKGLSYNEMFSFGRNVGPSGSYVKEAANSISRAKQETERLKQETESSARAARDLASAFRQAHDASSRTSGVMSDIKSLLLQGGIVYGAQQFANSIIQTGGDIVQQHMALRSIIGDISKADTLFSQTQELALQSPFKFQELNRDVKQLAAFGVETNKLYDTTKRLADIASGLGVSFERLGLAYGQVKSRSWLDGKELRQFAYAGLPMLQKIADLYNENKKNGKSDHTTADVRKMISKREVSFDDVDSVIKKMTDEGGQFYNMQFVLSETLLGQWNKLIDAWEIMLGKFAEGDSIIGGVFKTAIKGAAAFVLQLDRISPLLLSFGAVLAGKQLVNWGLNALSLNTGRIALQMSSVQAAQLKMYANSQMQAVMEGKITTEVAQQNILRQQQLLGSKAIKEMAYAQLFAEGKINAAQIAGLMRRGEISSSLVVQLRQMQLISAEQEKLILLAGQEGNTRKGNLAMMRLSTSGIGSGLGGLMSTGNIAMMGAAVGLALWMGYSQWNSRIEQQMEATVQHARQQIEIYSKGIETASSSGVTEESVRNMQDIVENSDLYSKSMKEQIDHAKTLQEKYDVLLNIIKQMGEQSKAVIRYSQESSEMIKATSVSATSQNFNPMMGLDLGFATDYAWDFLFNDDIEKNITDYERSQGLFQNIGGELESYKRQIIGAMNEIKGSYADVYAEIQGKPFEEQLRILSESDAWGEIKRRISQSDTSFSGLADTYQSRSKEVADDWNEIVNDDIPRMFAKAAYERGMDLEDYKNYCKRNPEYTQDMIRSIVHQLKNGSAETKGKLSEALIEFFGLAKEYADRVRVAVASDIETEKPLTPYDKQTDIGKRLMRNIVDKYGNGVITTAELNTVATDEDDWEKVASNIKKQYSSKRESYLAAVAGHASRSELAPLYKEQERWRKVALANGITPESKSDRKAEIAKKKAEAAKRAAERAAEKARRAEERRQREILHTWQRRKKLLEEYYETWEKWRKIEGREDAKTRLRNDKRFGSISKTYTDPGNLAGNLERLVNGYSKLAKTEDQRNFLAETRAEASKKEADIEYKNASDRVEMLNEQLDLLSKQYDLYQKLSKVTSSSVAAEFSFGSDGVYRKDKGSYYGYLRDRLKSIQGKKLSPKNFVNNEMPVSERDKKSLEELRVTASVKKVNFGPEGLDGVLKLTDNQIKDRFGEELSKIIIDFKKETDKLDEKIADSLVHGFEYLQNYQAEIDSINQSCDEQIERLEKRNQLEEENAKYISNEALRKGKILLEQQRGRDISNVNLEAAKHSASYYNFFGAITTLSTDEAEKYGATIRDIVNKAFQSGAIDAREYTKQMKQINDQMEKLHNSQSDFITYLQGGLDAVIQKYKEQGDEMQNRSSNDYEQASKYFQNAKLNGDTSGMQIAQNQMNNAKIMGQQGEAMSKMAGGMKGTVSMIDAIVNGINNAVQSMKKFVDQLAEDFDTLGKGGDGIRDSKGYQFVSGFSEASQGAADGWNSLKSGNVMGAVTGVYRSFAGWFTGTARARDAKLDRQIQLAERQLKALGNLQSSIERNLKKTLGGVYNYKADKDDIAKLKEGLDNYSMAKRGIEYGHDTRLASKAIGAGAGIAVGAGSAALSGALLGSAVGPIGTAVGAVAGAIVGFIVGGLFGHKKKKHTTVYREETNKAMEKAYRTQTYYDQQFAVMNMQLDQTNAKIESEKKKKKKDEGKIEDYKSQVAELKSNIATFAMDMAKSLYDIDLKSWAKELTNAIVEAWSKGEDAAKAYHDKVRDLMKNLTTNILTTKVMEAALSKTQELIKKKMVDKSGLLDESDILDLADIIEKEGADAVENITKVFEALKARGLDLTQNGSSSIGNGIKSITEDTADILASYLNQCRADLSVVRNLQSTYFPQMSDIANSQLAELRIISINTQKNAETTERILSLFRDITTPGLKKVNIH